MADHERTFARLISSILFLALLAVACYAHHVVQKHALPISTALTSLIIVLPIVHSACSWWFTRPIDKSKLLTLPLSSSSSLAGPHPDSSSSSRPVATPRAQITAATVFALTVLSTTLATLSATHLAPANSLDCALHEQWVSLFRHKNEHRIRTIQDALQCCGFRSVYDMAWPFPRSSGGRTQRSTCAETYNRSDACFGRWRAEEQKVAGLLLMVCAASWIVQMLVVYAPSRRPSWLQSFLARKQPHQSTQNGRGDINGTDNRAIGFHEEDRYTDEQPGGPNGDHRGQAIQDGRVVDVDDPQGYDPQEHHTLLPSAQGDQQRGNGWANIQR